MTVAAEPTLDGPTVLVQSTLLGPLSVPHAQVFGFPRGVFGFPETRGFALVPATREGIFWFQSVDQPALTFLLVDPFRFVDGFSLNLSPHKLGHLHPENPSDVIILSILTLPEDRDGVATVNLQGPMALNVVEREGMQTVLDDSRFGTRHPINLHRT